MHKQVGIGFVYIVDNRSCCRSGKYGAQEVRLVNMKDIRLEFGCSLSDLTAASETLNPTCRAGHGVYYHVPFYIHCGLVGDGKEVDFMARFCQTLALSVEYPGVID